MHTTSKLRYLLVLLAILCFPAAVAQRSVQLGAGVHYGNGISANAHADIPLFRTGDLGHSVRPQVTYAFEGLPALSATYVVTGKPAGETLDTYLGAGAGVSFAAEPLPGVIFSVHALAGVLIPVTDRISAFTEVTLAGSSLGNNLALGVGARYALGRGN